MATWMAFDRIGIFMEGLNYVIYLFEGAETMADHFLQNVEMFLLGALTF